MIGLKEYFAQRKKLAKEANDEIAKIFFKGETHSDVKNIEIKNITSFDDTTMYALYEVSVGYDRPVFKM